jgi:hypothetical protein
VKLKELPISLLQAARLNWTAPERLLGETEVVPVIVSMTTIPSRLGKLALVLRSLLQQTVRPLKIVVWMHEPMKAQIPQGVSVLIDRLAQYELIELRYTPLRCSHKKLIHTVEAYPQHVIVTCDDDFMYHKDWLDTLYQEHLAFPGHVIAQQIRSITRDDQGRLKPYKQWRYLPQTSQDPATFLAIGGKGVLYPKQALHPDYKNSELFLRLAPKADDLWFKAMELRNNTPVRRCTQLVPEPIPIIGTQSFSLKKENVDRDLNVDQWQNLSDYFNLPV